MRVERRTGEINQIDALRQHSVHIVAFAEEGLSNFKALADQALGIPIGEAVRHCNEINSKDETGTLWPRGNLTALPKRFFRDLEFDRDGFRRCLRDAFIANRDYCKSSHLVFEFSCVQLHLDDLFELVQQMAESEFADSGIEQVTVHFS